MSSFFLHFFLFFSLFFFSLFFSLFLSLYFYLSCFLCFSLFFSLFFSSLFFFLLLSLLFFTFVHFLLSYFFRFLFFTFFPLYETTHTAGSWVAKECSGNELNHDSTVRIKWKTWIFDGKCEFSRCFGKTVRKIFLPWRKLLIFFLKPLRTFPT